MAKSEEKKGQDMAPHSYGNRRPYELNKNALYAQRWRRRRQLAMWQPLGVSACYQYTEGRCPYYTSCTHCGAWRRWSKSKQEQVPLCYEERRTLVCLADSLTLAGIPSATAMILSGLLVRSGKDDSGKLHAEVLKQLGFLQVEVLRQALKIQTAKGNGSVDAFVKSALLEHAQSPSGPSDGSDTASGLERKDEPLESARDRAANE